MKTEKHPEVETKEGYQFSFLLIFFGKLHSYAQLLGGNKTFLCLFQYIILKLIASTK